MQMIARCCCFRCYHYCRRCCSLLLGRWLAALFLRRCCRCCGCSRCSCDHAWCHQPGCCCCCMVGSRPALVCADGVCTALRLLSQHEPVAQLQLLVQQRWLLRDLAELPAAGAPDQLVCCQLQYQQQGQLQQWWLAVAAHAAPGQRPPAAVVCSCCPS